MTTAHRHYLPASVYVAAGSFSFRFPKIVSGATARDVDTGGPAQSGGVRTICKFGGALLAPIQFFTALKLGGYAVENVTQNLKSLLSWRSLHGADHEAGSVRNVGKVVGEIGNV